MNSSTPAPWEHLYRPGLRQPAQMPDDTTLSAFRSQSAAHGDAVLIDYFGTTMTIAQVDAASDALAAHLEDIGVGAGERVATSLQNMPQYVIALLATWKVGGALVPLNPMLRSGELTHQLQDSGAVVLVTLDTLWHEVAAAVVGDTAVRAVITTSAMHMQDQPDPRVLAGAEALSCPGTDDFLDLLREHAGRRPTWVEPAPADLAFLVYTSGTTGTPKGSMSSHRNVAVQGELFADWVGLGSTGRVLALAPLFHITGIMCQLIPCLMTATPLVLAFRFHPDVLLEAIRRTRPTFTVGPVTAFMGMIQSNGFQRGDFDSFERVHSGGAPISPATACQFREATGQRLLGAYGMTEATAATHLGPEGIEAPVDPVSGALAVGIPIPGVSCRIVDDRGEEVEAGTAGEVVLAGPGVVTGYWNRPDESASTIRDGQLYSGDIGVMDEHGWLFLVDRKKDLINCSGFKVWPREVEDALYEHPAVREAAVIGIPDTYRGETVKAFVSLRPGAFAESDELIAFTGERLAAYKRPTHVVVLPDLPKTATGKILRRALRPDPPAAP